MKKTLLFIFAAMTAIAGESIGQTRPDLGDYASTFSLFTSVGALKNSGESRISGNVGTNAGAYNGFTQEVLVDGVAHVANSTSLAASSEMQDVYNSFNSNNCDNILITPLGGVVPLSPGVYCTGGATTINGNLILDGGGVSTSIFIFRINGALSTATNSKIILQNGASVANVYWQVNGAFSMGANSIFRGIVVAGGVEGSDAAIELLPGAALFGKALTVSGAITLNNNTVNTQTSLPVTLTSFVVKKGEGRTASLTWATTAETNSDKFEIEHSLTGKTWKKLGSVASNGESTQLASYDYTDEVPAIGVNLYRLKMIDKDLTYSYSRIRDIEFASDQRTVMYPNPAVDKLTLDVDDISMVERIQLNDITGKMVYDKSRTTTANLSEKLDVTALPSGMYVARITRAKGEVAFLKIVKL